MAKIFLSYAREDAAKAGGVARALERVGHQVWWDAQIGGGTRFGKEIATALKGAELVIVLWSRHSIDSDWVHDEAAEGRDRARLVPILLEDIKPPLGFRQFQAINLSRWTGKSRIPNFAVVQSAVTTVLEGGTLVRAEEPAARGSWWARRPAKAAVAVVALLLIIMATLYATSRFAPKAEAASLAVLPFTDLSPTRDKGYFAEGVSEEIRTLLSSVPGVQVVGRTSIEMLGPKAGLKQVREQLGVTHMLEGSMRIQGERMHLNVRLLRTADGVQIWAEQFDRELEDIFKVQNEIGAAVADRLRIRLWLYPTERRARTSVEVYDLVLAARGTMGRDYESSLESYRLAEQATRLDPNYAPAWVERARSIHAIDQTKPEGQWGPKWPAERERALRYARHAVELDPNYPFAQAFLGWVESDQERPELALPRVEKAVELGPGEPFSWGIASVIYAQMCDRERQLEAMRRWIALEPLDPAREDLILALYALGHDAEAEAHRRKLAQTHGTESLDFWLAANRGDLSAAVALRLKKDPNGPQRQVALLVNALGKTDRAIDLLPSGYRDKLGAYWRRDYQTAAAQTSFIATAPWNNARTVAIERALVWTGKHRELVDIFDKRFGSVAELDRRTRCNLPVHAAPLAMALRRVGRGTEANQLLGMAQQRYRQALDARDNRPEQHVGYIELMIVAGRNGEALSALERSLRIVGSRDDGPPIVRLDLADPIYDPIRDHPRFKAVERRIAAWRAKELRELAAAGVRI